MSHSGISLLKRLQFLNRQEAELKKNVYIVVDF